MRIAKRRLIYKVSTSRLKKARWNLTLSLDEARNNNELIALGDSTVIRWIDELKGNPDVGAEIARIKASIRELSRKENTVQNRHEMRRLRNELDEMQFIPDYVHVIANSNSDFLRATHGFKINGIKFVRLVGTNGGLKNSTVVFVNVQFIDELRKRIDNGRDMSVKQVPGKFEAYRALVCSGSIPVSMPNGIIVVNDCKTHFKEDVIMLNDEGRIEPLMTIEKDCEIELDESDGYGLMSPELAKRWSEELGLTYTASGMCSRYSYEKGMLFPFDFHEFAKKIAGKDEITDAWGDVRKVSEAELILNTSMLKLWSAYPNMETYLKNCEENHYTFAITKVAPEKLEDRRATNYQFLQSYELTDDQIEELIAPTVREFNDVLTGDYRKAMLFMCGMAMNDKNIHSYTFGKQGALMAEPEMFKDPHMKRCIYNLIKHRIDEAKIGVINVHGNYSIVCGDPYALCQSMFDMPVTGLMKAGEIYNKYWVDSDSDELACFRAPMSCHNNIRKMKVCRSDEAAYWYRHITTCTLLNAWDTTCASLNGMDKDGDLVMLTDNKVLVENIRPTMTIMCVQRNAEKIIPTEATQIASNLASFGDDIGKTTNKVTAMYDVQSVYDKDSEEYRTLEYRIMSGQLYQQNCIDKIKGIVCNPMPRGWYDYHSNALHDNPTEEQIARRDFNVSILADKKPYFMQYIYPTLRKDYKTYMKSVETKCIREFRMTLDELTSMDEHELTDEQKQFISYYKRRLPVGANNCVMNRICRKFEQLFDGKMKQWTEEPFDYTIMKAGCEYTPEQYAQVKKIYEYHNDWLCEQARRAKSERNTNDLTDAQLWQRWFRTKCMAVCSNEQILCDIVLDLCYRRSGTKEFAWDVCANQIIANLANRRGGIISYPTKDENGDIEFASTKFTMTTAPLVLEDMEAEPIEGNSVEREGMGEIGD